MVKNKGTTTPDVGKICNELGIIPKIIRIKLTIKDRRRSKAITEFIGKIEKAHEDASKSKLSFP